MSEKWDHHFLNIALMHAIMSKDPNTQYGAVIVGPDREVRSSGFNGFPRGIADTPDRLEDRTIKNELMIHAELNAILNATRSGTSLTGCTLYFAGTDSSGTIWGGVPCTRCTLHCLQTGIVEIVSYPWKSGESNWTADNTKARSYLCEADTITYREVPLPLQNFDEELALQYTVLCGRIKHLESIQQSMMKSTIEHYHRPPLFKETDLVSYEEMVTTLRNEARAMYRRMGK